MYGSRRRYAGDPHRVDCRYPGKCAKCGAAIPKGGAAFYYPNGRHVYGSHCGCAEIQSAQFSAAAFDELVYQYGAGRY